MTRSAVEPRPSNDPVEQVFLSPRVLDRTAFEEFAGALRLLIEEAGREAQTLTSALSRAAALSKPLCQVLPKIEGRLAEIERAACSIMSVRDETMALLSRAEACVQRLSGAEAHLDAIIDERLAAFGNRMQNMMDEAEANATERVKAAVQKSHMDLAIVEARLGDGEEHIRQLSSAAAGLGSICDRATAVLGRDAGDPGAVPRPGSLAEAILIAERTIAELHATSDQSAAAATDAARARRELARTILDAAAKCDELKCFEISTLSPAMRTTRPPADTDDAERTAIPQEIEAKPAKRRRPPAKKPAKPRRTS